MIIYTSASRRGILTRGARSKELVEGARSKEQTQVARRNELVARTSRRSKTLIYKQKINLNVLHGGGFGCEAAYSALQMIN